MADIIYLVRHAAPPETWRGRFWGRGDPGVDEQGMSGLYSLLPLAWERPTLLLSSPLRRAEVTAEALGHAFGLEPELNDELAEADFGDFDGLTFQEIENKYPIATREWAARGDNFHFPGGESVRSFLSRAEAAWKDCVERENHAVLAVTHGGIIATWCCLFLRMVFDHRFAFRPAYAALSAFIRKKDGSGWEMAFFNNKP